MLRSSVLEVAIKLGVNLCARHHKLLELVNLAEPRNAKPEPGVITVVTRNVTRFVIEPKQDMVIRSQGRTPSGATMGVNHQFYLVV